MQARSSSSLFSRTTRPRVHSPVRARLAAVLGIAAVSAACSGATSAVPSDGKTAATSSALDPNGVISPTTYKFSLAIQPAWTAQPSTGPSDTGLNHYVDYAVLAVQVNTIEADIVPCSYGPVSAMENNQQGLLPVCVSGGAGVEGSPLYRTATMQNATDKITVGMSLDNTAALPDTATSGALGAGLAKAGAIVQTVGAVVAVMVPPPYDSIGVFLGVIGQGLSLAAGFLGAHAGGTVSCIGGLAGPPPAGSTTPADLVTEQFTAQQLQQLTANGPITLTYPVQVTWNGNQCGSRQILDLTISRDWDTGSGPAAFAKSSDSGVVRQVGGVDHFTAVSAPQPGVVHEFLSADGAWSMELITSNTIPSGSSPGTPPTLRTNTSATVAAISRTPTSYDVFFVDDSGQLWWAYSRSPGVWASAPIIPTVASYAPPPDGRVTVVSPTPNTVDVFWVGTDGGVHEWSNLDTSVYGSTLPSTAPIIRGISQLPPVVPNYNTVPTTQVTAAGIAPAGAGIAAVARTLSSIDVFFAGKDQLNGSSGGIWTSSFNGTSWKNYELAYTSGLVAQGANVTATAQSEANIDLFFAGTDGGLWTSSWYIDSPAYAGSPFSNGMPAYATSELPGTKGLLVSGQTLSALSPQPSERAAGDSPLPGSLQVAWAGAPSGTLPSVYVSSLVSGVWGNPLAIATPHTVSWGASRLAPISIIAPTSDTLDVLFEDGGNELNAATWNYPAPTYTLSGPLPEWKWQGWDTINGGLISDPALATPNANELFAAATGPDGTIWWEAFDSATAASWVSWYSIGNGGHAFTDPPAIATVGGRIEVFVRDPVTTHLLHQEGMCQSTTICDWPVWNTAGWEDLGGTLVPGAPTVVVSQPNNEFNVFATMTDGSAHTMQGTGYGAMGVVWVTIPLPSGGTGWRETSANWTNLSGGILGEPAAVSWGANRLDVFVRGTDSGLYHRYSADNGVTWYPTGGNWEGLGGSVYSSPTAVSWGANRLDVFVSGNAGQVTHEAWSGSAWGWDTIGGLTTPAGVRPAAIARGVGNIDLFAESTAQGLFTASLGNLGWSAWSEMSSCTRVNGTPAVVSRDGTNLDLLMTSFASNGDAAIWHNSTTGTFPAQHQSSPPLCQ